MKRNKERNDYFSEDEYKLKSRNYYLEPEKEITDNQQYISKIKTSKMEKNVDKDKYKEEEIEKNNKEENNEKCNYEIENEKNISENELKEDNNITNNYENNEDNNIKNNYENNEEKNIENNTENTEENNIENESEENIDENLDENIIINDYDDEETIQKKLTKQMNQRKNKAKIKQKIDYKDSIERHNKLQSSLLNICAQIEKSLYNMYYPEEKETKSIANLSKKTNPFNSTYSQNLDENFFQIHKNKEKLSNKEFQKLINLYKEKIKDLKSELDVALTMNKIIQYESLVKEKENICLQLKKENIALNIVRDNQIEKIEEYNEKVIQREEINSINEKIKSLKLEIKKQKETLNRNQNRIKEQIKDIITIQNKIKLINENISYKKKQKLKNLDNNNEENIDSLTEIHIDKMKKQYEEKYNEFLIKEQEYKLIIKDQEIEKQRLNKEIDKINENIKQSKHNLILAERKRKDYSYDYKILKEAKKKQNNELKNNKNTTTNNKLFMGKNTQSAINILSFNNKDTKKKFVPFNMNNKNNIRKPFNINKFMDKVESQMRKNEKTKKKNSTLRLIESLKFDIQSVMNKDNILNNNKYFKGITDNEKYSHRKFNSDLYLNKDD